MQYVHFERHNPATRREFAAGSAEPQAHIYVNPAAVAKVQGNTEGTATIFYLNHTDYDVVQGHVTDVARLLEASSEEIVEALNDIEKVLGHIHTAIEGIDCG
jgi:hypothetical protein